MTETKHDPAVGCPLERRVRKLCGSAMAHSHCRYAGEISPIRIHFCDASDQKYSPCEYKDVAGWIHGAEGIKGHNVKLRD